jgi:hypothetical protein
LESHWQHWPGHVFQQRIDHTACSAQQAQHSCSASRAVSTRPQLLSTLNLMSGVFQDASGRQPQCVTAVVQRLTRGPLCMVVHCVCAQPYCGSAARLLLLTSILLSVYFRLSNFFLQDARVGTEGVLAHPQATVYPHMLIAHYAQKQAQTGLAQSSCY